MRLRLALLTALIALFAQAVATAAAAPPTLDATSEAITISSGEQKLTLRLADASVRFESPCGSGDVVASIDSPTGPVHPSTVVAPPKIYRGRDCVAALMVFTVPNDRKLTVRVDAYPGVNAIFVKSSLTGAYSGARDRYSWDWSEKVSTTHAGATSHDWAFLPGAAGGIAVITNGTVSCSSGKAFVNALPKSRFLRPGETLDIGFGLAGVNNADSAGALSKSARGNTAVRALRKPEQSKIDYGKPAPSWLREAETLRRSGDDMGATGGVMVTDAPSSQPAIERAHDAGLNVIVSVNLTDLQGSDVDRHPDWVCAGADGNPVKSSDGSGVCACFHQSDLREAALSRVCDIMNLGADGVLLDRATPHRSVRDPSSQSTLTPILTRPTTICSRHSPARSTR